MREIKFKGTAMVSGATIYGYYFEENHLGMYRSVIMYYDRLEGMNCYEEIIPESVREWTGKRDLIGREIYEGDHVQSSWDNEPRQVVWDTESAGFFAKCLNKNLVFDAIGFEENSFTVVD
jgi:hypothetical protein